MWIKKTPAHIYAVRLKVFIHSLFETYKTSQFGCHTGYIYCGSPTVKDHSLFQQWRASNNVGLTDCLRINWMIHDQPQQFTGTSSKQPEVKYRPLLQWIACYQFLTPLIFRDNHAAHFMEEVIQKRKSTPRKSLQAVIDAGLHSITGEHPNGIIHLIRICIIHRLVYNTDVVDLIS